MRHVGLLTALLVALPWLFPSHAPPLLTFHAEWFTFALLTAAVGACLLGGRNKAHHGSLMSVPLLTVPLLAFTAYLLVQSLVGTYPERGWLAAGYMLGAVLALALGWYTWVQGRERWLWTGLVAGGFLSAVLGIMGHWQVHTMFGTLLTDTTHGMLGPMGQRTMLALYSACALAALLSMRAGWVITALVGGALVLAMAYTGSRVAWPLLLLAGLCAVRLPGDAVERSTPAVQYWLLVTAFGLLRWWPAAHEVTRAADGVLGSAVEGASTRWWLITQAWRIWLESPLYGVGWGELAHGMYTHAKIGDPLLIDRHAHNAVLQLMAETGVAGVLVLAGGVLWVMRRCWRDTIGETVNNVHTRTAVTVLLCIGVVSFTEFPLWHAQGLVLAAVMIGMLPQPAVLITVRRVRHALLFAFMVGVLLLGLLAVQYGRLQALYNGQPVALNASGLLRPYTEQTLTRMLSGEAIPPALYQRLVERALHTFPSVDLACSAVLAQRALHKAATVEAERLAATYGLQYLEDCVLDGGIR
jgi:O-antigen ligase